MKECYNEVVALIPDDIVRVEENDTAWVFTTHGLIQWVFDNASSEGLLDFITLWNSVNTEERINIIVDIAQAKSND